MNLELMTPIEIYEKENSEISLFFLIFVYFFLKLQSCENGGKRSEQNPS